MEAYPWLPVPIWLSVEMRPMESPYAMCSQLSTSTACQRTAGHSHSSSSEPETFPAELIQFIQAMSLFMHEFIKAMPLFMLQLRGFLWDKSPDCPSLPHRFAPQSGLTVHKPEVFRKNKPKDVLQKHLTHSSLNAHLVAMQPTGWCQR